MSLGGKSESKASVPPYIAKAHQDVINDARAIGDIGYTPYYGPDVAALSSPQMAAIQSTMGLASANGLAAPEIGMPAPQTFANGIQGYSSGGLFDQAVGQLRERRPGQYEAITSNFIDPVSGELQNQPSSPFDIFNMFGTGGR